ncbi:type VI secretion system baseplate subunit TssF [Psychromonas sp. psych-6C06]|uniref:type VI secretion system baseplate subunit TssF n=1 Tax=Psychromonas sp. psych-6C06 TaxID=2058089 RepID=UPI000C32B980|nr:type VI secretion system baseplate subunit TssF [Psychromonas sp. psych-6C06]PKF63484.1 type VI secretion system baseplate subunit TssF [Psychromonas sp. psych-6C06]
MTDELLPYYEKELVYMRQLGAEFAKEHPKIAARLGINNDNIEDPHASRLVESFAFLNARIQHKLNDDFPEISDALLGSLYPHYQRPLPSMSVVQFVADKEQLDSNYPIASGTLLETTQFQGENCRFTTGYDVPLLPIEVSEASVMGKPFFTPGSNRIRGAESVLKLSLKTFSSDIHFCDLNIDTLRFYLKGQSQHINPIYQMLLNSCNRSFLAKSEDDTQPIDLGLNIIKPVGFKSDEGLLPYPDNSFIGYRLLSEYFAFPEKFMFIDITGIAAQLKSHQSDAIDLYIYLNEADIELEHNIDENTFNLGCTPVINLFQHSADPIKLDHTQHEYKVTPDSRRTLGYEVYSIDKVCASSYVGEDLDFLPFYGQNHAQQEDDAHAFWFAKRRHAKLDNYDRDEGTDVFLSLVDLKFNPNIPEDRTLSIETMCSNRDLPQKLPYSVGESQLQCVDSAPPCSAIRYLVQPTRVVRPPLRDHARWRLISHLNLNFLSLTGGNDACMALKEMLRLYDFKNSAVSRALIESIMEVNAKPISSPLTIDGFTAMCRGIEITVKIDDSLLSGTSVYLFATVLEHFFGLYCSINSFTRLLIKTKNKEGYLKKCPPRAGEKVLL